MGEGVRGVRQNSEFVAFLFHDDLWEPTYLEKMLAALDRNPSAGFAAANHVYVKEGEVSTAPFYDQLHDFVQKNIAPGLHEHHIFLRWWLERGLRPNVIGEPSFVVLRRTLMDEVGPFNESMVQFLDSEYWARCLLKADWVYVPEILGKFRVHPAGMSAVNEQRGRGVFERFETLRHVITALPPEDRRTGNDVLVKALSTMIGRFLHRLGAQQSVSGQGSRSVGSFLLRHPLLTLRAGAHWALHHPRTDESFT
jgi:GT2 family glycosyltransferase